MVNEYDFFEIVDSSGQVTTWDTVTGERRYPLMELLQVKHTDLVWAELLERANRKTLEALWPGVAIIAFVHLCEPLPKPRLPWPTEAVRAQVKDWYEIVGPFAMVEYCGILMTGWQKRLIEQQMKGLL